MKKLVAISVLVAGLAAAAFAQDEGKWKFGFSAQYITDMLYMTSASGKSTSTPASGSATTKEFGKYNKGSILWFDNAGYTDSHDTPFGGIGSTRMLLKVSNSGENYDVYADIKLDEWNLSGGFTGILDFLSKGFEDWWLMGSAGIFDVMIGKHYNAQGWVNTHAVWGESWFGRDTLFRFGVWRNNPGSGVVGGGWDNGFIASNTFRTWPQWGEVVAFGVGLGDNFKFKLGYTLTENYSRLGDKNAGYASAWESKSYINGSFLLSGRPVDALTFDLFYSIKGQDEDTFERPSNFAANGYAYGKGAWANTAGVFLGIDAIENLGLSLGYTANFNVYETGAWLDPAGTGTAKDSKPVTYNAPIYSGIDLRLKYSGIENIGLTFGNNISLANVKGEKVEGYKEKITLGFGENLSTFAAEGYTYDWFHWDTALFVSLGFIENVDLTLCLGNLVSVTTTEYSINNTSGKDTRTSNSFRATLGATYGAGAVSLGIGLFFQLNSEIVDKTDTTSAGTGTFKGNSDVVTFGIPIKVKVAF